MIEQSKVRIVAGYGRSGTTWIQDVLATANSLRAVFEPMHPVHMEGADAFAHRYIAENREEPELFQFLNQFFYGDFRSLWADYRVIKGYLVPRRHDISSMQQCRKQVRRYLGLTDNYLRFNRQRRNPQRIVKLIRANMMLAWLQARFSARIVFVIRHPAAVVMSQMKSRKSWNPRAYIDRFRADLDLLEVIDAQTRQLLFHDLEDVESYTLCWCIENMIALEQAKRSGIAVVHYERLISRGSPEWQRIVLALELKKMPDRELVLQPSQQAWGRKARDASLLLNYASWMENIDNSVSTRIQWTLDAIGMKLYRVDSALPFLDCDLEQ
jgi:hypothetical protein